MQLHDDALSYFLPTTDVRSKVEFAHGFIDKRALLPIDFNLYGLRLYNKQLKAMPIAITKQIKNSLLAHGISDSDLI